MENNKDIKEGLENLLKEKSIQFKIIKKNAGYLLVPYNVLFYDSKTSKLKFTDIRVINGHMSCIRHHHIRTWSILWIQKEKKWYGWDTYLGKYDNKGHYIFESEIVKRPEFINDTPDDRQFAYWERLKKEGCEWAGIKH